MEKYKSEVIQIVKYMLVADTMALVLPSINSTDL